MEGIEKISSHCNERFGVGKMSLETRLQEEARELVQEIAKLEGKPSNLKGLLNSVVANVVCCIAFGNR